MGNRKVLFPTSLILSGLSSIVGMLPFVFVWLIVGNLLNKDFTHAFESINYYAMWAFGTAVGGVLLYFVALTLSHLAAFRVETNMRRESMKKIIRMPLGFFDENTSGRIRKIIDENVSITHGFLAHQVPDLAATILMPLIATVLIFVFDWRLGLACLIPVIFSLGIIISMMGGKGQKFMQEYMNSLEKMNTEAVEYVRGIPVVKIFQQTVYSFKNFHSSILSYRNMVIEYTRLWEKPMSFYVVIIHGFAYILKSASR
ncbi:ABC transporter transmembrane domain-containing protein [Marinifilum sp.]|uniref:ABC transporter transmembrane domain-containing protein n=1 Tax=Marinifilum sp. TaxID=2033137 RepID=UPI003BAABF5F